MASAFFTVLSTGQHFTEDQWLNMQAFSMLRTWLLHSGPEDPDVPDAGVPKVGERPVDGRGRVQVASLACSGLSQVWES